jgi:hypothetical protein
MRLLRDEQPVKCREPFPFRISAKSRYLTYVFKHIHKGNTFKEHTLYQNRHNPLLIPKRPLLIRQTFPQIFFGEKHPLPTRVSQRAANNKFP